MDLGLAGKRAIVTGSTGGIGEGIARTLAREGAAVVVQGRNESAAQRVRREIEATGGKAILAIGDLATDEGAKRVVDEALAEFGAIDILINNAGAYESTDGRMRRRANGSIPSIRTCSRWSA